MKRTFTLALALAALVACGKTQGGSYETAVTDTTGNEGDLMKAGADALWEQRDDAEKLKQALAGYEQVAATNPDREVLLKLVRGYYFLGDGHLTEMDDKLAAWDTAITYGKQCMGLNEEFKALVEKGDETEGTAARVLTLEDVPCTYWTAGALGKWGKAEGLTTILKYKDIIKAWMEQVEVLDATYFFTGPTRYFAAYYAALPSFAGQDLPQSQELFIKAIEANPDHFGNRVLYADYWATRTQDVAVFDEQLNYVLNADPEVLEGLGPEQRAEVRKAEALMAKKADLFLE
jgi:tetratricopeptide (TPR) repeat protein